MMSFQNYLRKYKNMELLPRSVHTHFQCLAGKSQWIPSFRDCLYLGFKHHNYIPKYQNPGKHHILTLKAAPPWMIDLIKIPKSVPVSRDLFPFKLTPRPADPESFRGISKVSCSLVSRESA